MKEIILNSSLTVNENNSFPEFIPKYFFNDSKGFEPITTIDASITHRNYLRYLGHCWQAHYGAIISPTILWNIVLNNLAYKVNKTPDVFKKYFTESDEKQEICAMQGGNLIDTALLIAGVSQKIPTEILEHVFPKYSTDTEKAIIANYTAFLDMVSPYYNYSMYLCGIPKIRVLGTQDDWLRFIFNLGVITSMIPEFTEYLLKVANKIAMISENTCDYSKMFRLDECGSGSQVEVEGWIRDFFIEQPRVSYPENFISCISKIDYHNYNDNKGYRLYAGLFTSTIEDGYLIPAFDNMYFVKAATETKDGDAITLNLKTKQVKGGIVTLKEIDESNVVKEE
jgi:hypothetical protein